MPSSDCYLPRASLAPTLGPSAGCACNTTEKIGVYGSGGGWANRFDPDRAGYKGNLAEARASMGIDWMTVRELSEAIPPAYTKFIGEQLLAHLEVSTS